MSLKEEGTKTYINLLHLHVLHHEAGEGGRWGGLFFGEKTLNGMYISFQGPQKVDTSLLS